MLGLYQCPTIVNNVETLCHVKHIAEHGRRRVREDRHSRTTPGHAVLCVSGQVQRPGYYEFEVGRITMGQLLNEVCGGPLPGRKFKAVIPGGSSAKILRFGERFKGKRKAGAAMVDYDWGVEDVPMDFDSLALIGTMGGSGGVIVMDDSVNMVEALAQHQRVLCPRELRPVHAVPRGLALDEAITARMVHGIARAEDGAAAQERRRPDRRPHDLRVRRGLFLAHPELPRRSSATNSRATHETKQAPRPAGMTDLV